MKRMLIAVSVVAIGLVAASLSSAGTVGKPGAIVIRHQQKGCHAWSLDGGASKASLDLRLARGGRLRIENVDPMVHRLYQKLGPAVAMRAIAHDHMSMVGIHKITGRGVMNHMGAALELTFSRSGVYRFTTKDLGDYFELKTTGKVNDLELVVRVS